MTLENFAKAMANADMDILKVTEANCANDPDRLAIVKKFIEIKENEPKKEEVEVTDSKPKKKRGV